MIGSEDEQSRPKHDHTGDRCPACDAIRETGKAALTDWTERRNAELVESIRTLRQFYTPIPTIARRLRLADDVVSFVLQHGRMPDEQVQAGVSSK